MSAWSMYWIYLLDKFHDFLAPISVLSFIGFIVCYVFIIIKNDEKNTYLKEHEDIDPKEIEESYDKFRTKLKKISNFCIVVGAGCLLIIFFLPTTKQAMTMAIVSKITDNEKVVIVTEKFLDAANLKLDKFIEQHK